jgi:hypothetical protein
MITLFTISGRPLLTFVFGPNFAAGADVLPSLAIAMTLLGTTYLCLQLLIAHHNFSFLPVLAAATVLQPVLITLAAPDLQHIALALTALNLPITVFLGIAAMQPRAWSAAKNEPRRN